MASTNYDSFPSTDRLRIEHIWNVLLWCIRSIACTKAKGHIPQLVGEFDRAAQRYSDFHTLSTNKLEHWYQSNYESAPIDCNSAITTFSKSCPDQDVSKGDNADLWSTMNLLSACVEDAVPPYVEMKIISDPSLMLLKYDPSLMALCFCSVVYGFESSHPGLRLLVFLLENNANFNEIYHGHSLWNMFLHIVHTKSNPLGYHEDLDDIFGEMEIMLQRGADVEVCCIEERTAWNSILTDRLHCPIVWHDKSEQHFKQPLERKGVVDVGSSDPSDDSASHISENYNEPWEVRHSLERIIKDIFETYHPDLAVKLLSLVAKKRAEKLAIEKQSRNQTPGSSGGNKGRKQKQRNRKKCEGKRGRSALADDSDY